MRSSKLLFVILLMFMVPTGTFAEPLDELFGDTDLFEQDIDATETELKTQEEDLHIEENPELFPADRSISSRASFLEESATILIVNIGGKELSFSDIPSDAWFAPYVRSLVEKGMLSGYTDKEGTPLGLFGPADSVTIEQLAKMALEAAEIDRSFCPSSPMNTTASGSWSAGYIACAEKLGWAMFSDAVVDVRRPALRSEVIVSVLQAFDVEFGAATGAQFEDVSPSVQFAGAIEQAAGDDIIVGYTDEEGNPTGLFGPDDNVKRAEIAKIVVLAQQVYGK